MADPLTNFLLVILIALISYIGSKAYDKINEILSMIRQMLISHQRYDSDIEHLKRNQEDHEERIRELEDNKK